MSTAASSRYAVRIRGHLDEHWSVAFAGLSITHHDDGTSTLAGPVADQAQLHGILAGLRDIGAALLEVRTDEEPAPESDPVVGRTLRTERLTLRPAVRDDAASTWRFRRLASSNEWLTGCPADLAGYRDFFADPARLATTGIIALGQDARETVIGDFMLRREDGWAQREVVDRARGTQAELGWALAPEHHGHGYATETVHELLRYSFLELGVRRVVATCFLENHASWRLMERVGMRREGHAVRESLHRSGEWLDTVSYALLDDEWRHSGTARSSRSPGAVG